MLREVWGEGGGELEGCGGLHSHAEVGGDLCLLATEVGEWKLEAWGWEVQPWRKGWSVCLGSDGDGHRHRPGM